MAVTFLPLTVMFTVEDAFLTVNLVLAVALVFTSSVELNIPLTSLTPAGNTPKSTSAVPLMTLTVGNALPSTMSVNVPFARPETVMLALALVL